MTTARALAVAAALAVTAARSVAGAQPLPDDVPEATPAVTTPAVTARPRPRPRIRCALTHPSLPRGVFDEVDDEHPPAIVATVGGYAVAWRGPRGGLRVASLDASWSLRGEVRELARPVTAFALVAQPTGAALAWAEPAGEVVVARLSAENESQNVPRVVARAGERVESVVVAPSGEGVVVAWESASSVSAVSLDPAAVPRGRPTVITEGRAPRLTPLPSQGVALRVDPAAAGTSPSALSLTPSLDATARVRWPAGAQGPIALGDAVWFAQVNSIEQPMMLRVPPGGPVALADPASPPAQRIDALVSEGPVALALVSERGSARQHLDRLMPDGSSARLATLRGWAPGPQTLTVTASGSAALVLRDASPRGARYSVAALECP
ncbi:MAG: hypothetical protein R3A52_16845 [Polyangiales bacterium]